MYMDMDTKRYALFDNDGRQVSEIFRLTGAEVDAAAAAVRWKYHDLYYIDFYHDSYIIKGSDVLHSMNDHRQFLENNRKKKVESSRKRKLALYEKLKKELEPTTEGTQNNECQTT